MKIYNFLRIYMQFPRSTLLKIRLLQPYFSLSREQFTVSKPCTGWIPKCLLNAWELHDKFYSLDQDIYWLNGPQTVNKSLALTDSDWGVHKNPPPAHVPRQTNPVHALPHYFSAYRINTYYRPNYASAIEMVTPFKFSQINFLRNLQLPFILIIFNSADKLHDT